MDKLDPVASMADCLSFHGGTYICDFEVVGLGGEGGFSTWEVAGARGVSAWEVAGASSTSTCGSLCRVTVGTDGGGAVGAQGSTSG